MLIANGIAMLELTAVIMGKPVVIHPTLMWDENTAVLADTGFPGQSALIRAAVEQAGVPFPRLGRIIVTHQDIDHIGSLPELLGESPRIEVLAGEADKPYIQGEKRLVKLTPQAVAHMLDSLPAGVPVKRRRALQAALKNPPKARVDKTVADGEVLPYGGGIAVIGTPGHTPGHICLYHRPSKTLVAADALTVSGGRLEPMDPQLNLDTGEAMRSLRKLARYDIETVICYHGGLYRGNVNRRIAELAQPL